MIPPENPPNHGGVPPPLPPRRGDAPGRRLRYLPRGDDPPGDPPAHGGVPPPLPPRRGDAPGRRLRRRVRFPVVAGQSSLAASRCLMISSRIRGVSFGS